MAGKNQSWTDAILNLLRGTNITAPTTIYVALFTAAPSDTGGGTEVSGGAYARQAVTFGAPGAGTGRRVSNSADVTFPVATANWGTVTHAALMTHVSLTTEPTYAYWAALGSSRAVNTNDQVRFPTGQLIVDED